MALFENFSDTEDFGDVTFFTPFDEFRTASVPEDDTTYREYRRRSIEFIEARNRRIEGHAAAAR